MAYSMLPILQMRMTLKSRWVRTRDLSFCSFLTLALSILGACNNQAKSGAEEPSSQDEAAVNTSSSSPEIIKDDAKTFTNVFSEYPWDMRRLSEVKDLNNLGVRVDFDISTLANPEAWKTLRSDSAEQHKNAVIRLVQANLADILDILRNHQRALPFNVVRLNQVYGTVTVSDTLLLPNEYKVNTNRLTNYIVAIDRFKKLAAQNTDGILVLPWQLESFKDLDDPEIQADVQRFTQQDYLSFKRVLTSHKQLLSAVRVGVYNRATYPFTYEHTTKTLYLNLTNLGPGYDLLPVNATSWL